MARVFEAETAAEEIRKNLARSFPSSNVNFLIGSGASYPAIPTAGAVEAEIASLFEAGDKDAAYLKLYAFLSTIQAPTNSLIAGATDAKIAETVGNYREYLGILEAVLSERRTSLLPKQATIFTTNYDLFIEQAAVPYSAMRLNDGFARVPCLTGRAEFSSRTFFTTTSTTGNLYNYKVDIPSINLIKLHGSLSWKRDGDSILFSVMHNPLLSTGKSAAEVRTFVEAYAVVLPETRKFQTTLMDGTYYELLRIYNNELDREGTLLVAFGFSFADSHILAITKRALKNPTLKLVTFAFSDKDREMLIKLFDGCNNVDIVSPGPGENLDFPRFNGLLRSILPAVNGKTK
jgi:SIR2-like domain